MLETIHLNIGFPITIKDIQNYQQLIGEMLEQLVNLHLMVVLD